MEGHLSPTLGPEDGQGRLLWIKLEMLLCAARSQSQHL